MQRWIVAALACGATLGEAAAQDVEVCILTATETLTAPRKPNIFETKLDCGRQPSEEQKVLVAEVNNAMNAADALVFVVAEGYELESASTRNSYTGNAIISTFALVKGGEDEAPGMIGMPPLDSRFSDSTLDGLPEADDPAPFSLGGSDDPADEAMGEAEDAMDDSGADEMMDEGGDLLDDEGDDL